jgi:hypothetical protein
MKPIEGRIGKGEKEKREYRKGDGVEMISRLKCCRSSIIMQ